MKKLLFITGLLGLFLSASLVSCESDPQSSATEITQKVWYLYYGTWDGYGRAKKGCDGWGLCNYRDCWSCDPSQADFVAPIEVDPITGEGKMTIKLRLSNDEEAQAIQQHLPFNIDADINTGYSVLHAGVYAFDPSIGQSGGYKLHITVTNPPGDGDAN